MNTANIDYILDIFRTITGDLPEQMLYREDGDSIELKTLDSTGSGFSPDLQDNGWMMIGCRMVEAA